MLDKNQRSENVSEFVINSAGLEQVNHSPYDLLQEKTPAPFDSSSFRLQGLVTGHIGPPVKTELDTRQLQPWKRA